MHSTVKGYLNTPSSILRLGLKQAHTVWYRFIKNSMEHIHHWIIFILRCSVLSKIRKLILGALQQDLGKCKYQESGVSFPIIHRIILDKSNSRKIFGKNCIQVRPFSLKLDWTSTTHVSSSIRFGLILLSVFCISETKKYLTEAYVRFYINMNSLKTIEIRTRLTSVTTSWGDCIVASWLSLTRRGI